MKQWLHRLLCRLLGHDWDTERGQLIKATFGLTVRVYCKRCGESRTLPEFWTGGKT